MNRASCKLVFGAIGILAAMVFLSAPAWAQGNAQNSVDSRCTTAGAQACVDWENGLAIAIGTGAPATWAKTTAQKHISATRAARLDAARNILELIKGINLDSSTNIQGAMVASDTVQTSIQGRLFGIRPAERPRYFSDGSVQVKLEANLREIIPQDLFIDSAGAPRQLLPPGGGFASANGSTLNSGTAFTGLIIDARGTGVQPAMSPKVYDPQDREVYGSAFVSREVAVCQGMIGYVKSIEAARKTDRVQGTPAVIKALEVKGANSADLVISQEDADSLRAISQKQTFLREARVMIVLD